MIPKTRTLAAAALAISASAAWANWGNRQIADSVIAVREALILLLCDWSDMVTSEWRCW